MIGRDLLGIEDLTREEIQLILETAERMQEIGSREVKKVPTLRGRTVVNLFLESSTRTLSSFEIAGKRLSADVINFSRSSSSLSKSETILDTARTLDAMDPDVVNDPTYADLMDDALLDIQSISIVTDPDHLFDPGSGIYVNPQDDGSAWERETSVELINPDGTDGFQINGGILIRGGSSRTSSNPKHSFRLL